MTLTSTLVLTDARRADRGKQLMERIRRSRFANREYSKGDRSVAWSDSRRVLTSRRDLIKAGYAHNRMLYAD